MNRFFRRMERFGKRFSARRSQGEMRNREIRADPVRTKSWRHGKTTADKWNQ